VDVTPATSNRSAPAAAGSGSVPVPSEPTADVAVNGLRHLEQTTTCPRCSSSTRQTDMQCGQQDRRRVGLSIGFSLKNASRPRAAKPLPHSIHRAVRPRPLRDTVWCGSNSRAPDLQEKSRTTQANGAGNGAASGNSTLSIPFGGSRRAHRSPFLSEHDGSAGAWPRPCCDG
jgi:hypothetical protein